MCIHYSGRLLMVACIAVWSGLVQAQESLTERFVLVGDEAYGLLPSELVCGPSVSEAKWSPDGRYVLSLCSPERITPALARVSALVRDPKEPPGDLSLVVLSRDSHRSHEVWRRPLGRAQVEEFRWLPNSDRAVAIISETVSTATGPKSLREVLWMRAGADSARMVAEIASVVHTPELGRLADEQLHRHLAQATLALIVTYSVSERKLQMTDGTTHALPPWQFDLTPIRDDGNPAPTAHLPDDMIPIVWSETGSAYYLEHIEYSPDPKQKAARTWFEYDPRTGQVKQLPAEPPNFRALMEARHSKPDEAAPDLRNVQLTSTFSEVKQEGARARIRPLWLEAAKSSEQPRALVCADASWSQLSAGGDAVLYVSQGAACASSRDYEGLCRDAAGGAPSPRGRRCERARTGAPEARR